MAARKNKPEERTQHHTIALQAEDIALPRLRIVSNQSDHFKSKRFNEGDIVVGISSDDPDAERLYEFGSDDEGVVFHVLNMSTHLSGENSAGQLSRWSIGDPEAPSSARVAYEYQLCVPAYDALLPVTYTFSAGSAQVAKGINSALLRHQQSGPPWELCFRMTTAMKKRDRYTWAAPIVTAIQADQAALDVAEAMGQQLTSATTRQIEESSSF